MRLSSLGNGPRTSRSPTSSQDPSRAWLDHPHMSGFRAVERHPGPDAVRECSVVGGSRLTVRCDSGGRRFDRLKRG